MTSVPCEYARVRAMIRGRYSASEPDGKVIMPILLTESYPKHPASLCLTSSHAAYMTLEIDWDDWDAFSESESWFRRVSFTAAASKYALGVRMQTNSVKN